MDLRGLGSSGPSALICWGRYGSYMPVAGFVLRTSSRLAVDAGRLSVRAIPRTLMPAFRQSAMLMRSSWLRYLELIFWGMSTVERYQSTDGFSFLPFDRVLPLRHTLPVRLDTPTARAACVKFMPASRCSTYRRRRAAHISPRVAYSTPSNTHLSTWPSHQSARRCDDHWNPPYWNTWYFLAAVFGAVSSLLLGAWISSAANGTPITGGYCVYFTATQPLICLSLLFACDARVAKAHYGGLPRHVYSAWTPCSLRAVFRALILTSVNLIGVLCFDAIMVLTGTGIHPHLAAVLCFVVLQSLATSLIYSIVEIAADPRTAGIVSAILCYAWILLPGDLPDYATPYVANALRTVGLNLNGTVMSPAEAASRASVGPVMVVVPIVVLLVAYMLLSRFRREGVERK